MEDLAGTCARGSCTERPLLKLTAHNLRSFGSNFLGIACNDSEHSISVEPKPQRFGTSVRGNHLSNATCPYLSGSLGSNLARKLQSVAESACRAVRHFVNFDEHDFSNAGVLQVASIVASGGDP